MKRLIFNADDLGICESANRAIHRAFVDGALTSASLMANGPAFEHALESVIKPSSGPAVGLHLCLTSGRCLAPRDKIPQLADHHSHLQNGFVGLYRLAKQQDGRAQIERELDAQFQHVLAAGVTLDHVNSHRHVHMIPEIFAIVVKLAGQYGCRSVRVSSEPIRRRLSLLRPRRFCRTMTNAPKQWILQRMAKRVRLQHGQATFADGVFGILDSGLMDTSAIAAVISVIDQGVHEIITHPGEAANEMSDEISAGDRQFWNSPGRYQELLALLDPELPQQLAANQIHPSTYSGALCGSEHDQTSSDGSPPVSNWNRENDGDDSRNAAASCPSAEYTPTQQPLPGKELPRR